jgi:hypothetical protein
MRTVPRYLNDDLPIITLLCSILRGVGVGREDGNCSCGPTHVNSSPPTLSLPFPSIASAVKGGKVCAFSSSEICIRETFGNRGGGSGWVGLGKGGLCLCYSCMLGYSDSDVFRNAVNLGMGTDILDLVKGKGKERRRGSITL